MNTDLLDYAYIDLSGFESGIAHLGQQTYPNLFLFQPPVVQHADKLPGLLARHSDKGAILFEFDQADLVGQ